MMRLLDCSYASPAQNLALEEAVLEAVDAGDAPDTLRLWESPVPFVVLGTGQVCAEEVHEARCDADGVPVLRRCSAGGCVLQGPGSLNYALFLTGERYPETRSLRASCAFVLDRLCAAFKRHGLEVRRAGISDLALGGRKVSGSAQRRKRNAILHHGTLLYRPDTAAMARYLREPAERPEYRGARTHTDFITALPLSADTLRNCVVDAFGPCEPGAPSQSETDTMERLRTSKYELDAWNKRR